MLHSINEYLDIAAKRSGLKSDRQLCAALGLTGTAVHQFRKGSMHPSGPTMVKLAQLAGENEDLAVLQLDIWKHQGTTAEPVYRRILDTVMKGAACFILAMATLPGSDSPFSRSSIASELSGNIGHNQARVVAYSAYYGAIRNRLSPAKSIG